MKDATKQAKVLGFSELETAIFSALAHGECGISDLAEKVGRSHSSLYRPLHSLKKRGLVEMRRTKKRVRWGRVNSGEFVSSFGSVLFSGISSVKSTKPLHSEFFLHSGKEALKKIYYVASEQRGTRILGIQPNKSIQSVLMIFSPKEIVDINTRIKKRDIIVEAILQEDIVSTYAASLKKKVVDPKEVFRSFASRAADTTYIPKQFLDFDSEILILPRSAYLINWGKLVAVEIHDQEAVGFLRGIFSLIKHAGHKIDQNVLIQRYLKNEAPYP